MSGSIWADVLDAMYDQLVVQPYHAAEIAAERLRVSDGPYVNNFAGRTLMCIGALPVNDDESETSSDWEWASLGRDGANADVDDALAVPCGIHTKVGDRDMRKARRAAWDVFAATAAFYRGTTLDLGPVMWLIPQMATLRQSPTADGSEVLITFLVHVRTRI